MSDDGFFSFEVKGLDELQTTMEALPFKVAKKGLRAALKDGGSRFMDAMVSGAPKATGFLAEHFGIKFKMSRDLLSGTAYIGPQGKVEYPAFMSGAYNVIRRKSGKIVKVGRVAVATVARFLEFGTSKMGKQPFMTQAFETQKQGALEAVTETLRDAVMNP